MKSNIDIIYNALSHIDDAFVDEAAHITAPHRTTRRLWVRYGVATVACVALVVTVGTYTALNAESLDLDSAPESTASISQTESALSSTESDTNTNTDNNDLLLPQTESDEIIMFSDMGGRNSELPPKNNDVFEFEEEGIKYQKNLIDIYRLRENIGQKVGRICTRLPE